MSPDRRIAILGAASLALCIAGACFGQEKPATETKPPEDQPARAAPSWQDYFRRLASEYRMTAGESKTEVTLVKEPLLKWSQPVRGGQDGAVYLWLHEGRPAAIGTFFIWPNRDGRYGVSHELHALAATPIQGDWRERIRWRPGKDPVDWRALREAPVPAGVKAKQSAEARKLARRFAATSRNKEGQTRQLRLQPRPFFEYGAEMKKGTWQGGALFSLVEGTDTELVLWLEARAEGDSPTWHYAFARTSDLELRVTLDDKEVWKADFAKFGQSGEAYFCLAPEFLREPPPETGKPAPPSRRSLKPNHGPPTP